MSGAIKAEKSGRRKRLTPRSRSGCLSCRHHHRKCDEQRPVCGLCQKFGRDCDYGLKLTWGGRPFQKSAFGQCLSHRDTSIGKIKIDRASGRGPGPFVYGFRELQAKNPLKALELNQEEQALVVKTNETPVICAPPSVLPDLPPPYRALLDYFTHVADSFSCDELVKADFNSTFIPIAINTSHVMAAMLNLAAVHGANSGRDQSPRQMAHLQVVAVEQLRSKLINPSSSSTEAILSSILLLCYSEIVAGGGPSQSWRLHLEGAASVLREDLNSWNMKSSEHGKAFLARCFVSLVALASVSGHPPSAAVSQLAMEMSQSNSQLRKVDEFTAYSTDLVQVLIELGVRLRKRGTDGIAVQTRVESSPVASLDIVQRVHQMLQRGKGNLGNRALLKLPTARKQEYLHMDEAYHQAALVHIHQRLRGLPSSSNEIQTVVRRVLNLVSTIKLHQGPCPGIVLLFPLFSAGVGAVSSGDRQYVRSMLSCMVDKFGLGNVQQSMKILEALWSHRDRYGESEANITWEGFIDENTDLILY